MLNNCFKIWYYEKENIIVLNSFKKNKMNRFLYEILEQPEALQKTVDFYQNNSGRELLKNIRKMIDSNSFDKLIFTGMGSSNFLSQTAASLFNEQGIFPAFAINAAELLHFQFPVIDAKTLLVCISQSGESFEIIKLLEKINNDIKVVGITNESESTLAQKADLTLLTLAGKEEMTSTKTFVSALMTISILVDSLSNNFNEINYNQLIQNFKATLDITDKTIDDVIDFMGDLPALTIIARGAEIATAFQAALMFKETTKIPAYGILGGEFRHGPMEMVKEGFKAILFTSEGKTSQQNIKMALDIVKFGGKVLLITNIEMEEKHKNLKVISIKTKNKNLFAVESLIPIELFIDHYTKKQGYEAGVFTHGAKVTVIE